MKVVINTDFGGFGLSTLAYSLLEEKGYDLEWRDYENRAHPALIEVVEKLGTKKAGNGLSSLCIYNIPDNCYDIHDRDGFERLLYPSMEWITPKYENNEIK